MICAIVELESDRNLLVMRGIACRKRSEEFIVRVYTLRYCYEGHCYKATHKSTLRYWNCYLSVKENFLSRWFLLSLLKNFSVYTTRKHCIYDTPSMTVLENHFRIWRSGNFVNRGTKICFYVVHFKAIINNHLRMYGSGNLVIA